MEESDPHHPGRSRRIFRFSAGIAIALITTVLGLELVLQLGALVVGATGRDPVTGWVSGHTRVLALGDSNTYGWSLPPEESYPAQLEALWNAEVEAPKIEVINLGYPGTNSSVLLKSLPSLLDTFEPDVVLVMIGVNDFWTDVVARESADDGPWGRAKNWLRKHSRAYKLAYMIRRSLDDLDELDLGRRDTVDPDLVDAAYQEEARAELRREIDAGQRQKLTEIRFGERTFELGWVAGTGAKGDAKVLRTNLGIIVAEIRKHGSQPILLTYPANHRLYGNTNRILRRQASKLAVPLIDVAQGLVGACPEPDSCPHLFFPDLHAKAPGYALAARKLVDDLRTAGLLEHAR